jgi:hypothetical protein
MNATTTTPPPGYWLAANGDLVPESKVKQIDQLRNELVYALCQQAQTEAINLSKFKASAMLEVASFCALSQEQYKVKTGGNKGNVTLVSYDGKYKIIRQMQDTIVFGEQLLAAKVLIDECVREWAKDANDNIKVMVNHAFQTDKTGKINTARVLALRQLDIVDARWANAMQAIADSMRTASSKPYIRFYKRDEKTMEYLPITLDVAAA